jgi:N-acetyl-gamma-glutamyl-phosphate reductase
MVKVFIDGQSGTTGLQIVERLNKHDSIQLVEIAKEKRKDPAEKKKILNSVDLVILCLPDEAARESVALISNTSVKILDASSAHRTAYNWVYGLPELEKEQRSRIEKSRFVSVPGCYPTGFVLAMAPLIKKGLVPADYPVSVHAVSGYSGGGRQLIEKYENREAEFGVNELNVFRPYGFQLKHKHIPEMQKYTGLEKPPVFLPSVGHFLQGMLVMVPISLASLTKQPRAESIVEILEERYRDEKYVRVYPFNDQDPLDEGFLTPLTCNGSNRVDLMVHGHESQIVIIARLDNLGKGASGAAVQNLNLMMGLNESTGLAQNMDKMEPCQFTED